MYKVPIDFLSKVRKQLESNNKELENLYNRVKNVSQYRKLEKKMIENEKLIRIIKLNYE
jgi:hypothetical protein